MYSLLAILASGTLSWRWGKKNPLEQLGTIAKVTQDSLLHLSCRSLEYYFRGSVIPMVVTLKDSKVYVGIPMLEKTNPHASSEKRSLDIFLLLSGYRDDKRNVEITTNYLFVYEKLGIKELSDERADSFVVVVPVQQIVSVHLYDLKIPREHFKVPIVSPDDTT